MTALCLPESPATMRVVSNLRPAARTLSFTESVIREMTRLALEHDAINLAQGFPDFPAPEEVKQAAKDAIDADLNQCGTHTTIALTTKPRMTTMSDGRCAARADTHVSAVRSRSRAALEE